MSNGASLMHSLQNAIQRSGQRAVNVLTAGLLPKEADVVGERARRVMQYNVGGGKHLRARLAVDAYSAISTHQEQVSSNSQDSFCGQHSSSSLERVLRAGAAIEILQGFLLMADDIMDGSEMRRGTLCWYRNERIGLSAVNDALLLREMAEDELRDAFKGHVSREAITAVFRTAVRKTLVGQVMDMETSGRVDEFNWERYEQIVENKTSSYTFVLPLEVGANAADCFTLIPDSHRVGNEIGFFFQAQDDYLDVYGVKHQTGKNSTDIQEGKCTWLSCRATDLLQRNPVGMAEFRVNYGRPDEASENRVKEVYEDLRLADHFKTFECSFSERIEESIRKFPSRPFGKVLSRLLQEIRHRKQ